MNTTSPEQVLPVDFIVGDIVIAKRTPLCAVGHDTRRQKDQLAFIKTKQVLHVTGVHSHVVRRKTLCAVLSVKERPGKRFDASEFLLVHEVK